MFSKLSLVVLLSFVLLSSACSTRQWNAALTGAVIGATVSVLSAGERSYHTDRGYSRYQREWPPHWGHHPKWPHRPYKGGWHYNWGFHHSPYKRPPTQTLGQWLQENECPWDTVSASNSMYWCGYKRIR